MATSTTSATSGTGGILSSLGIGSGLDVPTLVAQLVTADTQADTARITRQTQQVGTQLSAIGQLKGALATFQSALSSLNTQADFQTKAVVVGDTAATGDTALLTASAGASAAAGKYQVSVERLAQAQQLRSTAVSGDGSVALGTGTLTLSLASASFSVNIDSNHASLNSIRDAINAATDNPGVSATVIHGINNSQLVLNSTLTGASNTITVTAVGGDGGLQTLAYAAGNRGNYTELQPALDAAIKVAGVDFTSPKNTVTGVIDGITLNLLAAKPGTSIALTVSNDNNTVTNRIQAFVSAYNNLQSVIGTLGSYDAAAQKAGPLLGDAILVGISAQVRRTLSTPVASAGSQFNSLASIGITTGKDGTLSLDANKLNTALSSNFNVVSSLFGATDGVAAKLSKYVDGQLAADSGIVARNKTLTNKQQQISADQSALAARRQKVQDRYTAQFTALDKALAQLQQTSSYLTQQFANLAKINSG